MSKAMMAVLATAAALAAPSASHAETWYAFYMVPSGVAYLDKDSVVVRPGHVTARIQSTFPGPQRIQRGGKVYVYAKARDMIDIDCKARVYRFLARDLYDASGQEQISINEADAPLMIVERSPQAVLAEAYCQQAR